MLERRKRISKKEIKQDKLVTTYYKAVDVYQKNQMRIFIGAGLIVLAIAAIVLYYNNKSKNNLTASSLLSEVIPIYDKAQYKNAIEGNKIQNIAGLQEIVDKYGNTETGETAKIYLANSYYYTGKIDSAYDTYDDYGGGNPLLKAASLSGKAACLEDKKEFEKAAQYLIEAEKISEINPGNPEYLLRAANDLIQINQKDKAKEILNKIKEDYKTTSAATEADKLLVKVQS